MIQSEMPLSMPEVGKLMKETKSENVELEEFLKKFNKLEAKDAEKIREELQSLNNIKLKEEHIVKVIDLLPEDGQEINKIFVDVSLSEDEKKQILDIIKRYK